MGGKTSKSTQTVSIPPEVLARYNAVNARAETAANTPFKQYGGEFVAGLTGSQRQGMSNINAAANMAQPYYGAAGSAFNAGLNQGQGYLGEATQYARAGGYNVDPSKLDAGAIGEYISPYLGTVLQGVAGLQNQQNQQAMSGQLGNAVRSGAFGGDRVGIQAANLNQQQRIADANIFGNILNTAYNNAVNTAAGQQSLFLNANQANRAATQATADRIAGLGQQGFNQYTSTGQNVQGLGTAAQNAAIQGGKAQMDAGAVEQATNQALDTAKFNQFKEEQSYPFQVGQYLANIAEGTGALSGSTTTTAQPGGFFSDARLKENIEKVGKTYDGQHIYRYNYKGDPTTQIGLIAQEVERHHPDAVGSAGHYRTVDYDKATDHAADRGHFYAGGLASMGGGVGPMQAGQGFAEGGLAGYDPAYMAELYRQLYAAGTGHGINGMQGIPVTPSEIHELMVAKGLQGDSANKVTQAVDAIDSVGRLGNTLGAWHYGEKESPRRHPMDERTGHALGGDIEDPEAKRQAEEAGLAKAALEASKPEPQAGGLSAPAPAPTAPVKIEAPKADLKFGDAAPSHRLAVANAPVKPTNHGSQTIDDIGKLVQIGASIAGGMNQGGRIHRDLGGGMPYSNDQSIVPQQDAQQHQLMTAQGIGSGGGGAGKAVGQIAGLASSLIPGGGIVKKGLGAIGKLFSDERMKENIRPIGELFDGQKVHSFNYKGDPRTQIGLIAQEVEHHSPHAVDHDHGMKTVDYHDATQHAAHRGHFAEGGMPEEMEEGAPEMLSPVLMAIRRRINPLNAGIKPFHERLAQDRHNNFWNVSDDRKGLAAAASPAPAENILQNKPIPMKLTQRNPEVKEAPKPGLSVGANSASLPTNIAAIAQLIRLGEGSGQNKKSSAYGPYQMVDSTFADQFRQHYPDRAKGMSDREIINLKRSPEGAAISDAMGPKLIASNAKIIERGGFEPDAGNVYLAHFLGPDTAVKVLRANPNAPISHYVSQEAINANPPLQKNPTVGGAINWARGYMAKQADYLNREHHAAGGLAGRQGYQDAGAVFNPAPQAFVDEYAAEEERKKNGSTADPQNIIASGLAPAKLAGPQAATGPAQAGSSPDYTKEALPSEVSKLAQQAPAPKTNKFFPRLFHGETDAVLSALKGIAAMGAAPTRSLGVALATGLGAGAEAYQGQRQFGLEQKKTAAQEMQAAATERESFNNQIKVNNDAYIAATGRLEKLSPLLNSVRQQIVNATSKLDLSKPENQAVLAKMKTQEIDIQNGITALLDKGRAGPQGVAGASPQEGAASPSNGAPSTPQGGLKPPESSAFNMPVTTFNASDPTTWGGSLSDRQLVGAPTGEIEHATNMLGRGLYVDPVTKDKYITYQPTIEAESEKAGTVGSTNEAIANNSKLVDQIANDVRVYQDNKSFIDSLPRKINQSLPPEAFVKIANGFAKMAGLPQEGINAGNANANIVEAAKALNLVPRDMGTDIISVNSALQALFDRRDYTNRRNQAAAWLLNKNGGKYTDPIGPNGVRIPFSRAVNDAVEEMARRARQKGEQ